MRCAAKSRRRTSQGRGGKLGVQQPPVAGHPAAAAGGGDDHLVGEPPATAASLPPSPSWEQAQVAWTATVPSAPGHLQPIEQPVMDPGDRVDHLDPVDSSSVSTPSVQELASITTGRRPPHSSAAARRRVRAAISSMAAA